MVAAVIMAGGKGERFWPRSRKSLPKQLIKLVSDKTMIQETVDRLDKFIEDDNVYIVTGEEYKATVFDQLGSVPKENIIIEPMGKNTAACIGLAAMQIARKDPDTVMIVLPSDHLIKNRENFISVLEQAAKVAELDGNIITIGITPTLPETGYGYINFEDKMDNLYCDMMYKVKKFVEKPDKRIAQKYLDSGKYLWNSGMFLWKASTILNNIEKYMPKLYEALVKIDDKWGKEEYQKVLYDEYSKLESISIDYGIMEFASNVYVIPGIFGWDDVGSWTSLERIHESDESGNIISGNIIQMDTSKCIIQGGDKLIATLGIEDLIIVDTEDATLICSKDKAQQIKGLLAKFKDLKAEDYL